MNQNELRIGNIISCENKEIIVKSISGNGYDINIEQSYGEIYDLINLGKCSEVEITEERLKDFCFEEIEKGVFKKGNYYITKYNNGKEFGLFDDYPAACNSVGDLFIKSIHQLQNLYFSLTGEELNKP